MIVSVSTVKDTLANVQRFVAGNLAGGVDHLVVFVEGDDAGSRQVLGWLEQQSHVTPVAADAWWGARRPDELNVRQRFHANVVRALVTTVGDVDWLFHIDGDEIVQIDRAALAGVPRTCRVVRLAPREAVSRKHWDRSPTWFKRLLDDDDLALLHVLGVISRPANGDYFHGHVFGKVGVRPALDLWLTLHQAVDADREPIEAFEDDEALTMLHFESYSGEDFVRKWLTMIEGGSTVSLRKARQGTAQSVGALAEKPLSPDVRSRYLMRIFEATTEDDFETLRELGLLVEVDPGQGRHQPEQLPEADRSRLAGLLHELGGQKKDAFKVCGPAADVERVLRKLDGGGRFSRSQR